MEIILSHNFSLDDVSTTISNQANEILPKKEDDEQKIEEIINKACNKQKITRVIKHYIITKIKVKNFFPYEPIKLKRDNIDNLSENRVIFNILNELQKIKVYMKNNKEKGEKQKQN